MCLLVLIFVTSSNVNLLKSNYFGEKFPRIVVSDMYSCYPV